MRIFTPMKVFKYPRETWSVEQCNKMVRYTASDGMGTKYPFKGYIGSSASRPAAYGVEKYNGGIVIDNEFYDATLREFPILPNGFEIVAVSSWGWRIVLSE